MSVNLHPRENSLYLTPRADDIGRPHNTHALLAVKGLLLPCAVSFQYLMVRVAGQGEIQLILISELCQLFWGVCAHAQDFSP